MRLGSAAEEVSAGSADVEVEDVSLGRSVEETVSVVLPLLVEVCCAVVVAASSLPCVAESVAPALSSVVACGVCDVVVALASFLCAATLVDNSRANNAGSHGSLPLRRPMGKMRCRIIILATCNRVSHTPTRPPKPEGAVCSGRVRWLAGGWLCRRLLVLCPFE